MKVIGPNRLQVRVKITGTLYGNPFEWSDPPGSDGQQFISPAPDSDGNIDISEYWWAEGNMSCDCNRLKYAGVTPETHPDFYDKDGSGLCGERIRINCIVPLEGEIENPGNYALTLDER